MNTIESISKAVDIFRRYKIPYALLHCTNVYPTPFNLVRLGALTQLQEAFPDAVTGLSDHTISNSPCLASAALGGSILERHFTDHMGREGPDIVCSMDEKACSELITMSAEIHQCLGGKKGPVAEEQPTIDFAFASVVTIRDIEAGEVFSKDNLWVKRPGTGEILADEYESLLGRTAAVCLKNDTLLKRDNIK